MRSADQRAFAAQRLAAGAQRDDILPPVQPVGQAPSVAPENAGAVGFIDDQKGVLAIGQRGKVGERGDVSVHAVDAFDRDPDAADISRSTPLGDAIGEGVDIIMVGFDRRRPAEAHAFVRAGVDQRVVDDQVATCRQSRKYRAVGGEARREEQAGLAAEEACCVFLQRLVLGIVAAQQSRAACTDRYAPCQRCGDRLAQLGRTGQAQIIIRSEIEAAARDQATGARPARQEGQCLPMGIENGHGQRP